MLPKDACEEIDAAFFSGDTFHDDKVLNEMVWYLKRWINQAITIQEALKMVDETVKNERHP